jgi:uncharacterized OsmC-like protein
MLGTLAGGLEAREITLEAGAIEATVQGFNEVRDRLPVLTRIHVSYTLRVPAGSRDTVERLLRRHAARCPTAMSLKGAVDVTWEAEVREGDEAWTAEGNRDG